MFIKYALVQQEELTLVCRDGIYTREQLTNNPELLNIFDGLNDMGNILFPDYITEPGGKRVLVGAHAIKGNSSIKVDLRNFKMTIS